MLTKKDNDYKKHERKATSVHSMLQITIFIQFAMLFSKRRVVASCFMPIVKDYSPERGAYVANGIDALLYKFVSTISLLGSTSNRWQVLFQGLGQNILLCSLTRFYWFNALTFHVLKDHTTLGTQKVNTVSAAVRIKRSKCKALELMKLNWRLQ